MKFCIQLEMKDDGQDVWIQKDSASPSETLEIMNELFHVIEMLIKATRDKNMEIHMHLREIRES